MVMAMLLAAGKGERMRPLTDTLPKPLLPAGRHRLIEYPLMALARAGVREVVVNLGYRGPQIREFLGDGGGYGLHIAYSDEGEPPLETGGGLLHALPLLGDAPFVVVNADVYSEYPLERLVRRARELPAGELAYLVMVPNPAHNPRGDFGLAGTRIGNDGGPRLTFSGLSVQHPGILAGCRPGRFPMLPLWRSAADAGQVAGELYEGTWSDVGTPQRLAELERALLTKSA
jgi:N-acetyl-alpha-D-muramate 1-phosphate uridylyltransferase